MSQSIRCSHCDAVVKAPDSAQVGKMKCPECRETFTVDNDAASAMQTAPPPPWFKRSRQDEDTVDYDEPPRRPASLRRSRAWPWVILVIAGGAFVLLLAIGGAGAVAWYYYATTRPQALLVGNWRATEPVPGVVVEFHREGTLIVRENGLQASARYRLFDDKLLELEIPNPAKQLAGPMLPRLGRFNQPMPGLFNQPVAETIKVNATILTLTRTDLVIRVNDVVQRFKRVE